MKIGVTLSETSNHNYPRWIKGTDENIDIVELSYEKFNLEAVALCDGIVLTGGIDMEPIEKTTYINAPETFNPKRDTFEMAVLANALKSKKPILGICRGLQLINVYKGGTLHLDNGDDKNDIHQKEIEDKKHLVQVTKNSLFYSIVKAEFGEVNSAHHQSIAILGKDLKAVAHSEDGVIEGIESTNPEEQFLLAVQWHPERMDDLESPFSKNIRKALIEKICN